MSRTHTAVRSLAAGVIAVASATGCSLIHPAAPPTGLQQQISQGTRADTHGRSRAAAARPARPSAGTAGRMAARVPGTDITAIGDSVMLAGALALHRAFPGIYIDAVESRHTDEGLSLLRQLAAAGTLRPVVIVGLGTNGGVTAQQIRQLMAIVGSRREVVLVNTFVPLPYEQATNRVLAAAARTYPNVTLANWYQTISVRTRLLWPDGIHPQPSGAKVYAAMIKTALAQAAGPGSAGGR